MGYSINKLLIINVSLNLKKRFDGSMNKKERSEVIKNFSENRSITVILVSLKAGAFGLNLVAANNVFICDPWYNPAVEVCLFLNNS